MILLRTSYIYRYGVFLEYYFNLQFGASLLRVTSEYQSFHYMEPEIIIKRMVGECSSSVTDSSASWSIHGKDMS